MTFFIQIIGGLVGILVFQYPLYLLLRRIGDTALRTYAAVFIVMMAGGLLSGPGAGFGSFAMRLEHLSISHVIFQMPGAFLAMGILLVFRRRPSGLALDPDTQS